MQFLSFFLMAAINEKLNSNKYVVVNGTKCLPVWIIFWDIPLDQSWSGFCEKIHSFNNSFLHWNFNMNFPQKRFRIQLI